MGVLKVAFVFLIALVFAGSASAEVNKLTIRDCNKEVKLAEEISTSSVKVLAELEGEDVTKLSAITLTNNKTSVKTSKAVANNKVILDEITAGDWTLCSEPEEVGFKSVAILKDDNRVGAGIAGVSLASIGAVAVLLNNDDSNSNRGVNTSTPNNPAVTEDNVNEVVGGAVDNIADKKDGKCKKDNKGTNGIVIQSSNPCDIGGDTNPVSPFL